MPKDHVVIEVPQIIKPSEEIIDVCQTLKKSGFNYALNNFRYSSKLEPIIEMADFLKIDIKQASQRELEAYAIKYADHNVKLVADQVNTLNDYYHLRKIGYNYFQGYYFSKPEIIKSEKMPSSRITKLRLIHEVNKDDFDFREAEDILKHDPGLTIKLLKYVNSAAMGLRTEVHGIRQALTMIGQRNLRKWISILAVSSFTDKKPTELMLTVVKRGQFCELLGTQFAFHHQETQALFLIGMFSLLDAVIDLPLDKVFEVIPLSDEIRDTVLGEDTPFRDVLDLAITLETGDWDKMNELIKKYKLVEKNIVSSHVTAIEWANCFVE